MITFTKTHSAACYISRHASSDIGRCRALVLLKRLGACEAALAAAGGGPGLAPSLLGGLALTVRELVGSAWLSARTDDSGIAAFTALDSTPAPRPPTTSTRHSPGCCGPASRPRPAVTVTRQPAVPALAEPLLSLQVGRCPRQMPHPQAGGSFAVPGGDRPLNTAITCPDPERRPTSELRPVRGGRR